MKKTLIALLLLVLAGALILVGCQATRAGYESAPYKTVRSDGKFQVRDYPALTVVETPMGGSRSGDDGSFMRLFRFITGSNEANTRAASLDKGIHNIQGINETIASVLNIEYMSIIGS